MTKLNMTSEAAKPTVTPLPADAAKPDVKVVEPVNAPPASAPSSK